MTPRQIGLLAALAGIWGASYLLIKYAIEDLSPAVVVFLRTALGAAVLFALLAARSEAKAAMGELRSRPRRAFLLGFVAIALPFVLIAFGELEVPSGLTAVLIAPASLFVAMLAPFMDREEMIDRRQAVGLVAGLVGVAFLVGIEFVDSLAELLGALAIIGAAVSYAVSAFVVKSDYKDVPSMHVSFVSVLTGAVLTLPAALAGLPSSEMPDLRAILAIVGLGALGTAVAFLLFYELIAQLGAGRASLVSYLTPPVSLAYGALLLSESITVATIVGLVLILGGVALASRRPPEAVPEQTA